MRKDKIKEIIIIINYNIKKLILINIIIYYILYKIYYILFIVIVVIKFINIIIDRKITIIIICNINI